MSEYKKLIISLFNEKPKFIFNKNVIKIIFNFIINNNKIIFQALDLWTGIENYNLEYLMASKSQIGIAISLEDDNTYYEVFIYFRNFNTIDRVSIKEKRDTSLTTIVKNNKIIQPPW